MVDGYLGYKGVYFTIMIAVNAIHSIQTCGQRKQGVRTEPVLATAVFRAGWMHSWVAVPGPGVLWLFVLAGLGNGLGAAVSTGGWDLLDPELLGQIAHTPAV